MQIMFFFVNVKSEFNSISNLVDIFLDCCKSSQNFSTCNHLKFFKEFNKLLVRL